jgi:hypothetical protein
MLAPRQEFPVTHLDGKLYAAGGMNSGSCCNAMTDFDEYHIATDTWRKRADLPVAVNHPVLCALDGKVYVISGYTGGKYRDQGVTNRCFAYMPAEDSWKEIASLDKAAAGAGVVTWNGKIYVFGGDPDKQFDSNPRSSVMEYDPAKDSWRLVNDKMPHARTHIGAGMVGTKVYLSPGRRGSVSKTEDNVVQEFDMAKMDAGADAWRVMNPMPSDPRTGYMSNWPVVNGRLYYIGGENPMYKTVHEFTPDDDGGTWRRVTDYPFTIHGIGPIAVGNRIYVSGSASGSGVSNRTDESRVYTIDGGAPVSAKQGPHAGYRREARESTIGITRRADDILVHAHGESLQAKLFRLDGALVGTQSAAAGQSCRLQLPGSTQVYLLKVTGSGRSDMVRLIERR